MTRTYLVRAYTKTGVYSHTVEASSEADALLITKPILRRMLRGIRIYQWFVQEWRP